MLTRSLAVIAVLIGTGCAPFADKIPEFQTTCEQTRQVFAEMVACIKSTVAESKLLRGRDGDLTKLYLAYADVLVEKVDGNKMSDAEARLELTVFIIVSLLNQNSAHLRPFRGLVKVCKMLALQCNQQPPFLLLPVV